LMIKLLAPAVVEEFIPYTFFKIFPGERWGFGNLKSGGPLEPNNGDRLIKISRVCWVKRVSLSRILGSVVSAAAESERARCIC